jgi:hypothetical protein
MIVDALGKRARPGSYVERCLSRKLTHTEMAAVRGAARQIEAVVRTESGEIAKLCRY